MKEALGLVLCGLPNDAAEVLMPATLLEAETDPAGWGELWRVADDAGATVGAAWGQLRPGGAALVWPPQWRSAGEVSTTATPTSPELSIALLDKLTAALAARGCTLAQSLLISGDCGEAEALRAAGFLHLAELTYLVGETIDVDPALAGESDSPIVFEAFVDNETERTRMAGIVERSYVDTLDCPALNGLRTGREMLDEYEVAGVGGSRLWRFVVNDGRDVGCLILAEHAEQDQVELVYMGLVPEARGRAWGAVVARESLRIAASIGRARVVLAVDSTNLPAAEAYERVGFLPWEKRTAFIKPLTTPTEN
ncbi:MAG: GNAT family N-acetyltransferase [Planctomycetia bacterium]|nr:GNAT family N-acetyltransferase [Planctomycetia bacterium]